MGSNPGKRVQPEPSADSNKSKLINNIRHTGALSGDVNKGAGQKADYSEYSHGGKTNRIKSDGDLERGLVDPKSSGLPESEIVSTNQCIISMPNQTAGQADVDSRSRQKIDEESHEQEKEVKQTEKLTNTGTKGEVEKKKEFLKSSLLRLKNRYRGSQLQMQWIDTAVRKLDRLTSSFNKGSVSVSAHKYHERSTRLGDCQREKARLLHRLSEVASARLRRNNPAITDLSDQHRPTKLAERLSELYDNEWTDVFEATKKKTKADDRKIAESLRDVLMFCSDKCRDIATNQRRTCVCLLTDIKKESAIETSPPDLLQQLKDFQKNTAQYSLPFVRQVVRNNAQQQKDNLSIKLFWSIKEKKNPYHAYVDLCTEISWYIQLQDPPLVFDFNRSGSEPGRFRPYTVSGTQLDFIIWPALLLHEGGPVVAKGVAQFKRVSDEGEQRTETETKAEKTGHSKETALESDWS